MTKVLKLKKGLDISLVGVAEARFEDAKKSQKYALTPDDYQGITPKMLVKPGDSVKAGTPVFFDKYRPNLLFTSPVSGTVEAVNRGEKRKIMDITILPESTMSYEEFATEGYASKSASEIKELMLSAGLWPMIIQRPYGIIANEADTPRDIFVSLFDSAPLGVDMNLIIEAEMDNFTTGVEVLKKLTNGKVHLGASPKTSNNIMQVATKVAEVTSYAGKHPAGLVGVQINNTAPVRKGDVVWTVDAQNVIMIGRFFAQGKLDLTRTVAVCGSEVSAPCYTKMIMGAQLTPTLEAKIANKEGETPRVISGNVLTGVKVAREGFLSFYSNQITVIPEGDKYEFLGWIAPRFNKFSVSKSYFSWLCSKKQYRLDTNCNGDERAYVMSGEYEKVVPMDIYPVYLIKAILAKDIDKMENLGIYEVIEEDFALCEFVCTSKIAVQKIIREGINLMIKELN